VSRAAPAAPLDPPFAADPGGMAALVDGIPEQIEDALARAAENPWKRTGHIPSTLAVGAMGGSAIAAELTAGVYADRIPRPLVAVRDYHWPAFVTQEAFALLASYSGATEETLSLYEEACRRSVPRAALTTGGTLAAMCDRDGVPWFKLPAGLPPRAALFSSWVPLTLLLAAFGWCDDPARRWREAAESLRALRGRIGTHVPEADNPVKRLARALQGRTLFLYSATGWMAPVATRLRQQLNENAKLLAHSAAVPELDHNEIVGWEKPEALHRGVTVLLLRDAEDGPEIARRLALTREYVERQGAATVELEPGTGGRLARMAAHVMFADYLSLYLALARGVDPSPVASIDQLKRRMAGGA
jgi:glucose/mannose-6-phosphate isomerase